MAIQCDDAKADVALDATDFAGIGSDARLLPLGGAIETAVGEEIAEDMTR